MRFIVINLSGILNQSLTESMKRQIKTILSEPAAILLDFEKVTTLEEKAIQEFREIIAEIQKTGSEKLSISCMNQDFQSRIFQGLVLRPAVFSDKNAAKVYLENANSITQIQTEAAKQEYQKVTQFTQKGDLYYINCPKCEIKLRIRSVGNHACPTCKTRFSFKPDLKAEAESEYQMLSLD